MTLTDLQHLIRYTHWANGEILDALLNEDNVPEKCVRLMAHLLAAEHLWLDRMNNEPQRFAVWPEWRIYDCDQHYRELEKRWFAFFEGKGESDLDRAVSYRNTKGEKFTNTVRDVILHIVLHAPHHRGQINIELRADGFDPVYVDYIHAVRTKQIT